MKERKGTKIARVALARHLVEVIYQMEKNEIDYLQFVRRGGRQG
jgi:hypothetical protein